MNPSISTVSSFADTSCIFEAVQENQGFSAAVWKKYICKYYKKLPFLVNIQRCPKFLEYALSTSNFFSVSGSLTEKLIIYSWLHCLGNPIVWFLIKPVDQADETERPNLVNKTGVAKRWLPNLFFIFIKFFLLTQHLGLRLRNKCDFFLSFFFIFCFCFCFFFGLFFCLQFLFRILLLGFVICNCKWGKLRTHFRWLLIRLVKRNGQKKSKEGTEQGGWGHGIFQGIEERECGNSRSQLKKKCNFQGYLLKTYDVEHPWVLVFDIGISTPRGIIQFCKIPRSKNLFSKGKVTGLKMLGGFPSF